jgi:hypothetical protein
MSRSQAVGVSRTSFFSVLVCAAVITACGGGGSSGSAATGAAASSPTTAPAATSPSPASPASPAPNPSSSQNAAPTIGGTPATGINVAAKYSFAPNAADANGDALTFSIQNKPAWATFDAATGTLSGTPAVSDVSTYANIVISVSDGATSVALPAFSVAVTQIASGNIQLSWTPPTQNTDESSLSNIAGYRIYYGTDPNVLDQLIIVDKGSTSYVVQNLAPAEWHFAVSAYTTEAFESDLSNVVARTVM